MLNKIIKFIDRLPLWFNILMLNIISFIIVATIMYYFGNMDKVNDTKIPYVAPKVVSIK